MNLDCMIKNGKLLIPQQGIIGGSIGIKDEKNCDDFGNPGLLNGKVSHRRAGKLCFSWCDRTLHSPGFRIPAGTRLSHGDTVSGNWGLSATITYYRQIAPDEKLIDKIKSL